MTEITVTKNNFDIDNDPTRLAKIGEEVSQRLDSNIGIQKIENPAMQIYVFQQFLNERDCQTLIKNIDQQPVPSGLMTEIDQPDFRTSSSCYFDREDADVARIGTNISKVLGIDNNFAEPIQGQRYTVGQEFKAHHDFFHTSQNYWLEQKRFGGQRTWTAMVFLNHVLDGGATLFPHAKIGVDPQPGTMLIWNNIDVTGIENYKSLHAGAPVKKDANTSLQNGLD